MALDLVRGDPSAQAKPGSKTSDTNASRGRIVERIRIFA